MKSFLASTYDTTLYNDGYLDSSYYAAPSYSPVGTIFYLAFIIFMIVSVWKVFVKAGKPGWASIVPFYNIWVLLEVANRPGWWLILYFIPLVNIVIHFIVSIDVAKAFGKDGAFGFFLIGIFGFIGYPIIAFGKASYKKIAR
ncbi:MAG TPA: DUF5684 domain-containing protein [Candidatus Saccharimonadales bacterium]|nr:DUF5684 domain-containing protein [Candidatus Saccharimonadales bacterium]